MAAPPVAASARAESAASERAGARLRADALAAVLLVGLIVLGYGRFTSTYFPTTDVWTLIDSSRVSQLADVARLFTQPLMAGTTFQEHTAEHYRPLASLSFALDYAVWGMNPFGYHLTNLGLHVLDTLLLYGLTRLLGIRSMPALLGSVLFAVSPAVVNWVPGLARRQDALAAAFILPTLILFVRDLRQRGQVRRWTLVVGGVFYGLAILAKETTLLTLPVAPVLFFAALAGRRLSPGTAGRRLAGPVVALAVPTALVLVLRWQVLGALGGYGSLPITTFDPYLFGVVSEAFARYLLWPLVGWGRVRWVVLAVALALPPLLVLGARLWLAWPRSIRPLFVAGLAWLGMGFAFYQALHTLTSAYFLYIPLFGLTWLVAASVQGSADLLRGAARERLGWTVRWASRAWLAVAGSYALLLVYASPIVTPFQEWFDGSDVVRTYLAGAGACVDQAPPGATVVFGNHPAALAYPTSQAFLASVTLMEDYSVRSAMRLLHPDRPDVVVRTVPQGYVVKEPTSVAVSCRQAGGEWHVDATYTPR